MTDNICIEDAKQLDLDVCRQLVLSSEPWITLQYGDSDVHAIVRSAASNRLLVARAGVGLVGFALSSSGFLLGEYLHLLVVDAAFRSRGIGRALMHELERRAWCQWPNVYLCVSDFNTGARAFYRRLGYEEVGVLKDLLVTGASEVLMRKSIGASKDFNRS